MADRIDDQIRHLRQNRRDTSEFLEALSVALDLGEEEAVYYGRSQVDSGDLLIGVAASRADVVTKALATLGLNVDAVRAAVDKARANP
jgi:hypothetical protein